MTAEDVVEEFQSIFPALNAEILPSEDFATRSTRFRTSLKINGKTYGRVLVISAETMMDSYQCKGACQRLVRGFLKIVEREVGEGFDLEVYRFQ
jgi:hypothetical protein